MICKICGRILTSFLALGIHLSKSHKDCCGETYYDKYMKNENEGVCVCGNKCKFVSLKLGYHTYCSHQCQVKNTANKAKTTKELKYGKGNFWSDDGKKRIAEANKHNKETRVKKLKETNMKKYGAEWASQNETIKEKVASTNTSRYGNRCALHGSNQSSTEEIFKEKYGFNSPVKNDAVKNKIKSTNMTRYGVAWPWASKECIEKRKRNYFEKTGYNYPGQNPEVRRNSIKHYEYDNQLFDSSWELAYFIWLKDHNIPFEYQCGELQYEYNGQTKTYFPDFYVNGQYVEIKGPQFFENGKMINPWDRTQDDLYEAKHQCMIDNKIKIMTDCSEYLNYIEEKYGKDYMQQFRNK